jgi:hypothetical protein
VNSSWGKSNDMAPTGRGKNVKNLKKIVSRGQINSDSVNDVSTDLSDQVVSERRGAAVSRSLVTPINSSNSSMNGESNMPVDDEINEVDTGTEISDANSTQTVIADAEEQESFFRSNQTYPGRINSNMAMVQLLSQNLRTVSERCDASPTTSRAINSLITPQSDRINEFENPTRFRCYPTNYNGKFNIYIRENGVPLSHITISKYICGKYGAKILEIVKVHKFKIRVQAADADTANRLAQDSELLMKFRVGIPASEVEINGVVSLNDIDLQELIEYGEGIFSHPSVPRAKIVDAYRLRRAYIGKNGATEYEDSDLIRVTFSGRALPKKILIFGLRIDVKMFYPKVMNCDKCFGYNHTSKFCTSAARCAKCGEKHLTASCQAQEIKCIYCEKIGGHTNGEKCPSLLRRSERAGRKAIRKSKMEYTTLKREIECIVHENPYGSLDEDSESDEESAQQEKTLFSQVLSGAIPKRPRPQKSVHKNSNIPPAKRVSNTKPQEPYLHNKSRDRDSANLEATRKNSPDSIPWADSLRASIFRFVKSFEWPQLWEKIALDLLGQLLDAVFPKISSFISSVLPSLFSNGQP